VALGSRAIHSRTAACESAAKGWIVPRTFTAATRGAVFATNAMKTTSVRTPLPVSYARATAAAAYSAAATKTARISIVTRYQGAV
jgi:hypothetical protein